MARAKNILEVVKEYMYLFYSRGEWVEDLSTIEVREGVSVYNETTVDFMYRFTKFLVEGEMLSEYTIIWLKSPRDRFSVALEDYNKGMHELDKVNMNTAKANNQYDKKKIAKYFDVDTFFHINFKPEIYLESYEKTLSMLQRKYMKDSDYRKSLMVKLPKEYITNSLDEQSFAKLKDMLDTYSKKRVQEIESGKSNFMTQDMIGYYNYLISSPRLSKTEKERLKQDREVLGID